MIKTPVVAGALIAGVVLGFAGRAWTQAGQGLPVPKKIEPAMVNLQLRGYARIGG